MTDAGRYYRVQWWLVLAGPVVLAALTVLYIAFT